MPKLWSKTVEAHRNEVREAILDTTASLVAEHGLLGVTMSEIAEQTGIGRATLYKYFAGVEQILHAWHERQVRRHLDQLAQIRSGDGGPYGRLESVLRALAHIQRERTNHDAEPHGSELIAFLHQSGDLAPADRELRELVEDVIAEAAAAGDIRDDVRPAELASYCLHALNGAGASSSQAATQRLVALVMDGLRPAG